MFENSQVLWRLFCFSLVCGLVLCQNITYCPDPNELEPLCSCYEDFIGIYLACAGVQDENQLNGIFTTTSFPTLNAYELRISDRPELKNLTRNVFGELTFKTIVCRNSGIEYIGDSVFVNSIFTLTLWEVDFCHLPNTQGFPFDSLSLYANLTSIYLLNAGTFDVLPKISSNSLLHLYVLDNELQLLPVGVFNDLPNLLEVSLFQNNIASIDVGAFDQNPLLTFIDLSSNNLQRLSTGTFANLPNLLRLILNGNNIKLIDAGAFFKLPKLESLLLDYNKLQLFLIDSLGHLPSLREVFVSNNNITFLENHLFIGCPAIQVADFTSNELRSIEAGTFDDLVSASLYLDNNQLTTLDENWLRTPLINLNYTQICFNPLECGCDMAWLFAEPSLMVNLTATCSNGTYIDQLDPSFYSNNC